MTAASKVSLCLHRWKLERCQTWNWDMFALFSRACRLLIIKVSTVSVTSLNEFLFTGRYLFLQRNLIIQPVIDFFNYSIAMDSYWFSYVEFISFYFGRQWDRVKLLVGYCLCYAELFFYLHFLLFISQSDVIEFIFQWVIKAFQIEFKVYRCNFLKE